jgi:hypothetical protein
MWIIFISSFKKKTLIVNLLKIHSMHIWNFHMKPLYTIKKIKIYFYLNLKDIIFLICIFILFLKCAFKLLTWAYRCSSMIQYKALSLIPSIGEKVQKVDM